MSESVKTSLAKALASALKESLGEEFSLAMLENSLEAPNEEKFGDLSTNAIFKIAKERKKAPRALAEEISKKISTGAIKEKIEKIAVEGPGFINFYFSQNEISSVLLNIRKEGTQFGKPKNFKAKKILLEYVSANPTGPLTVAHGRQAALGDSLARILKFCGHELHREYYNNDEGVQIQTLGESLNLRIEEIIENKKKELPENFYKGEYLIAIAQEFLKEFPVEKYKALSMAEKLEKCRAFSREQILKDIQKDLKEFGVDFDRYYSQASLMRSGRVESTLEELKKKGFVYENEGAVWLASTRLGDDKDRVLIKSDKTYTYLTPDIAYHHEKFERGFEKLINILGPDHHGYIARLKASQQALGHNPDEVQVLIAQLVTLYEDGKQVRMSTRAGEFVTLREILDEVGCDAGRFFFLMRKFDAHLDFDLGLAKSQTPDNPVFYIQYAHARVESVKRTYAERVEAFDWNKVNDLSPLSDPLSVKIMRLLSQFEDAVVDAERTLEPYRLVPYLMELAANFHRFYTENRVVGEPKNVAEARLALMSAIQSVIASGLRLLGVSAPLKM